MTKSLVMGLIGKTVNVIGTRSIAKIVNEVFSTRYF